MTANRGSTDESFFPLILYKKYEFCLFLALASALIAVNISSDTKVSFSAEKKRRGGENVKK